MTKAELRNWWGCEAGRSFVKEIEGAIAIFEKDGNTEEMCRDTVANTARVGKILGLQMVLQMRETEIADDEQTEDSTTKV
jgi:hypothetical protein